MLEIHTGKEVVVIRVNSIKEGEEDLESAGGEIAQTMQGEGE